jgi:hypothetical protein
MANSVLTTYPVNGSRVFQAVIQISCDGSGELAATTVIDPANLTGKPATFKIKRVNWAFDGFSGSLRWNASAPTLALSMPTYGDEMNFFKTGAPCLNGASSPDGKLTLTTLGMTSGDTGTITINGYH